MAKSVQNLTDLIAELPGIGPRQARRVVQYLLRAPTAYKRQLIQGIEAAGAEAAPCVRCLRWDELGSDRVCTMCADEGRDTTTLLVIEKDVDVEGIEAAGMYRGQYFVLGALMPLSGRARRDLSPRTDELSVRIKDGITHGLTEVVLAFATTPEGDFTARELKRKLLEQFPDIKISFLGRGLSLGAEIEYADHETLRSAFQGRSEKL